MKPGYLLSKGKGCTVIQMMAVKIPHEPGVKRFHTILAKIGADCKVHESILGLRKTEVANSKQLVIEEMKFDSIVCWKRKMGTMLSIEGTSCEELSIESSIGILGFVIPSGKEFRSLVTTGLKVNGTAAKTVSGRALEERYVSM